MIIYFSRVSNSNMTPIQKQKTAKNKTKQNPIYTLLVSQTRDTWLNLKPETKTKRNQTNKNKKREQKQTKKRKKKQQQKTTTTNNNYNNKAHKQKETITKTFKFDVCLSWREAAELGKKEEKRRRREQSGLYPKRLPRSSPGDWLLGLHVTEMQTSEWSPFVDLQGGVEKASTKGYLADENGRRPLTVRTQPADASPSVGLLPLTSGP